MTRPPARTEVPAEPSVTCGVCSRDVPGGSYCGMCGAPLPRTATGGGPTRNTAARGTLMGAYAADPRQRVLTVSVVSTLLPQLPGRSSGAFRAALGVLVAVLLLLGVLLVPVPALFLAALGLPLLYLAYLWEVKVYEESPVLVVGLTMGLGAALGWLYAARFSAATTRQSVLNSVLGTDQSVWRYGVWLPLLALALTLVGTVVLRFTRFFDDPLDGFAFGAAGALGFTGASALVQIWPRVRSDGLVVDGSRLAAVAEVLQRGLLEPVLTACLAGLLGAALWLRRGKGLRRGLLDLAATLVIAVVAVVVIGVYGQRSTSVWQLVLVSAVLTVLVLVWARISLQGLLLASAEHVVMGPSAPCPECGVSSPRMPFCPSCGISARTLPKGDLARPRNSLAPSQTRTDLLAGVGAGSSALTAPPPDLDNPGPTQPLSPTRPAGAAASSLQPAPHAPAVGGLTWDADAGGWVFGDVPEGYVWDAEHQQLVFDPQSAEHVHHGNDAEPHAYAPAPDAAGAEAPSGPPAQERRS